MKLTQIILILLLTISGAFAAGTSNNVIVISIDALHPDAVTTENCPNIIALADNGVLRLDGRSTNPPKTLISHSAMFTGLTPENGGLNSNAWHKGDATIKGRTIFNIAKEKGFKTVYVYSKGKLAYLENGAIDKSVFSKEYPIDTALKAIKETQNNFLFLHISGLDNTGPEYGWMSKEYIEDFKFIDEELKPLFDYIKSNGNYLIIVTSDHAGHEKLHGCNHPDDYKLPFVATSDMFDAQSEILKKYETYKLIAYLKSIGAL